MYIEGAGGVLIGGGSRKSLTPAGNRIHSCEIDNVNQLDPVAGYYNDLVMPHKVDFKSIGLVKK